MRTCVGCRAAAPQSALVRVTVDRDGALRLGRRLPGRGAWLCGEGCPDLPRLRCLDEAVRRKAFSRAFRAPVGAEAANALREMVQERARIESVAGGGAQRKD